MALESREVANPNSKYRWMHVIDEKMFCSDFSSVYSFENIATTSFIKTIKGLKVFCAAMSL